MGKIDLRDARRLSELCMRAKSREEMQALLA
jgi:hypothetical protein